MFKNEVECVENILGKKILFTQIMDTWKPTPDIDENEIFAID